MMVAAWHRILLWCAIACSVLIFAVLLLPRAFTAQPAPATHPIFMSAVEIKGSTTAEQLAPPAVNPTDLSKGYGFKAPGEADQARRRGGRSPATCLPRASLRYSRATR